MNNYSASYVVTRKSDGAIVCEIWGREVAAKVNQTKYDVTPILQHLSSLTPY